MRNKNEKFKISFYFLVLVFTFSFLVFNFVMAVTLEIGCPTPPDPNKLCLTPPGIERGETPEFGAYLQWLLRFLLGAVGILAVLMIIVGGAQYVLAGASGKPEDIKDAKTRIMMAIGGLVLALSSWLILSVINPDLLKLKLPSITSISSTPIVEPEKKGMDICFKCYNENDELIGCNKKSEAVSCDIRKETANSCAACDDSEIAPGELAETCRSIFGLPPKLNVIEQNWNKLCQKSSQFECYINYRLPNGNQATARVDALLPPANPIFKLEAECQENCNQYADTINENLKSDPTPPEARGSCVPTEKEKKDITTFPS